jgi:hypothetical protein
MSAACCWNVSRVMDLNAACVAPIRRPRSAAGFHRPGDCTTDSRDNRGPGTFAPDIGRRIPQSAVASVHRAVPLSLAVVSRSEFSCVTLSNPAMARSWPAFVDQSRLEDRGARPVGWLESGTAQSQPAAHRQQCAFPHPAFGSCQRTRLHDQRALGLDSFLMIGIGTMAIPRYSWKPWLMPNGFEEPAIVRRTGFISARRPEAIERIVFGNQLPKLPSSFSSFHSIVGLSSCYASPIPHRLAP